MIKFLPFFFRLLPHFRFASGELPNGCFHESTRAGNGVERGMGTGKLMKKIGAAQVARKNAVSEMAIEVGREEKQKNVSIQMAVMTEAVAKQEETCEVLKKRRFDAGKKLLEECCNGSVDLMKKKVKEYRESADEKKADGFSDDEFDDFNNDNKFMKEYVDVDVKFRIAKKRKLQIKKNWTR